MRISEAQRRARALLDEMALQELPIDVVEVAGGLGVTVEAAPLEEDISALLVCQDGRAAIGVNERHHPHRQRFSIAHELGHYVLHRDAASTFIDSTLTFHRDGRSATGVYQQEIEANAFAAELLMPAPIVRREFRTGVTDVHNDADIARVARKFGVSQQALAIRLVRLGLVRE